MSSRLLNELNLFGIAVGFFTRIPVPQSLDYSQQQLNRASRYFSLVGCLIGIISALVFSLASNIVPLDVAILLTMGVGFLLTGGFHEDGLADTADGLGGGWTRSQKLSIMKDSRLGSYGALAIWFALTLKFVLLSELGSEAGVALIIAHPLSRFMSTAVIYVLPYVADHNTTKVKPLAERLTLNDLCIGAIIGAMPLLLVLPDIIAIVLTLLVITSLFAVFLKRQIEGFTGDTLGATQQINELSVYLILLATGALL